MGVLWTAATEFVGWLIVTLFVLTGIALLLGLWLSNGALDAFSDPMRRPEDDEHECGPRP